jgi:hypothetical protein
VKVGMQIMAPRDVVHVSIRCRCNRGTRLGGCAVGRVVHHVHMAACHACVCLCITTVIGVLQSCLHVGCAYVWQLLFARLFRCETGFVCMLVCSRIYARMYVRVYLGMSVCTFSLHADKTDASAHIKLCTHTL